MSHASDIFVWEFIGTAVLLLLGAGVCANVTLDTSLGKDGGWLLISFGWGFAVFAGASVSSASGAHLNPAVSLALAIVGKTRWIDFPVYVVGQCAGGALGAFLCWASYKLQFDKHSEMSNTLGIFCTGPTVKNYAWNLVTEIIGTFVLIIFILTAPGAKPVYEAEPIALGNSGLGYLGVATVVVAIGASLGGPTGYAINPARDLPPRIVYALLPIKDKASCNWSYCWVPVVGPLIGAAIAGGIYLALPQAAVA